MGSVVLKIARSERLRHSYQLRRLVNIFFVSELFSANPVAGFFHLSPEVINWLSVILNSYGIQTVQLLSHILPNERQWLRLSEGHQM